MNVRDQKFYQKIIHNEQNIEIQVKKQQEEITE